MDFKMFSSNNLPIPESFNDVTIRALGFPWDYAWFVEEDVVVPEGSLRELVALKKDISAIDYMLKANRPSLSHRVVDGRIAWVSLGCTLIKREVFSSVGNPWFRTDKVLEASFGGSASRRWEMQLIDRVSGSDYGNQDVYFCFKAIEAGHSIGVVPQALAEHVEIGQA